MSKKADCVVLRRASNWFNPFVVLWQQRAYELKDIVFFKDGEEVVSVGRGWIDSVPVNPKNPVSLRIPFCRKIKEDLHANFAFVVSCCDDYGREPDVQTNNRLKPKFGKLYIPYDEFEWTVRRRGSVTDYGTYHLCYDVYIARGHGLAFSLLGPCWREDKERALEFLEAVKPFFEALRISSKDFSYEMRDGKLEKLIREWFKPEKLPEEVKEEQHAG